MGIEDFMSPLELQNCQKEYNLALAKLQRCHLKSQNLKNNSKLFRKWFYIFSVP